MNRGRLAGLSAAVILTVATGVLIAQSSGATTAAPETGQVAPAPQAESVDEDSAAPLPDGAVPRADTTTDRWITSARSPPKPMDDVPGSAPGAL